MPEPRPELVSAELALDLLSGEGHFTAQQVVEMIEVVHDAEHLNSPDPRYVLYDLRERMQQVDALARTVIALHAQLAAKAEAEAREEKRREITRSLLQREENAHAETIAQRDTARAAADRLAYACFTEDQIGEHTNLNDPWLNAAELLESLAQTSAQLKEQWGGKAAPGADK